jgi:hypothetical protein
MADSTLTALTAASALDGTELLYVVQGGADRKATAAQVGAGARHNLAADITYYINTTGNDTTGDGSSGAPWATPQKALDYLEDNIDFGGHTVTIQLAAGTTGTPKVYPEVEIPFLSGVGTLYIETSDGNPLHTTLGDTVGSADGVFAYEKNFIYTYFGGMTIYAHGACIITNETLFIGLGTVNCPNVNLTQVGGAPAVINMIGSGGATTFYDGGAGALPNIVLTVDAGTDRYCLVGTLCSAITIANYTIVKAGGGTHNWGVAFVDMSDRALWANRLQMGTNVTGATTGKRYQTGGLSIINQILGTLANSPGSLDATGFANAMINNSFRAISFWDTASNGVITIQASAAPTSHAYTLPLGLGPPGGALTDIAGDGTLGWLPPVSLVSALPAAATANKGIRRFVSDATVTTFASIVAGTGSNFVPVFSDGTNWRIG